MAYDPEARRQSNSALTIGLVSLLLLGGGLLAYFATRPKQPEAVSTTVIDRSAPNPNPDKVIINREVPVVVGGQSDTVVVAPKPAPETRIIERNTSVTNTKVVPAPAPATKVKTTTKTNTSPAPAAAAPAPTAAASAPTTAAPAPAADTSTPDTPPSQGSAEVTTETETNVSGTP